MNIEELDAEILFKIMNYREINKSFLARKYGVDRHTIARHINKVNGEIKERKARSCCILEYKDEIIERLKEGNSIKSIYMSILNRTTYDKLKSYSNFKQYVKRHFNDYLIEGKQQEAKYRYETPPGQQLQFDWVTPLSLHLTNGELIPFSIWNGTLGYSREHCFKVTEGITENDFKMCLIQNLISIGGVPKEALTDNMSAIVAIRGDSKYVHPTVTQFMKDLGIKLVLCKPRKPETKGKVEVSNKYQEWLDPYDYKFATKADLFRGIEEILNQSNYQINSETKIAPVVLFKKEKGTLGPLPSIEILKSYMTGLIEKTVNVSALIDYKNAKYGVPSNYINKKVLIKEEGKNIIIYDQHLMQLAFYDKSDSGIHYAKGLYTVAKMQNESEEAYNERIENNLKQLARMQRY